MKHLILGAFALLLFSHSFSQNKEQEIILNKFLTAHNNGSNIAIQKFIKDTYHPDIYATLDLNAHTAFYNQIVKEFGPLNFMIYKKVEEGPIRFVAHLITKEDYIGNENIDPNRILVVKIDLSKKNKKYMPHGLGLGSLVCEQRKED
jgi:hypothetical protein